jgi:hypothetical protein
LGCPYKITPGDVQKIIIAAGPDQILDCIGHLRRNDGRRGSQESPGGLIKIPGISESLIAQDARDRSGQVGRVWTKVLKLVSKSILKRLWQVGDPIFNTWSCLE